MATRTINRGETTYHAPNRFHGECRGCTTDSDKIGQPVVLEGDDEIAAILLWRKCGSYLDYLGQQELPIADDTTVESFIELSDLLHALRQAYSALHNYNAYCKQYPSSIADY